MDVSQLKRAYDFPGGRIRHIYRSVSIGPLEKVDSNKLALPFGAGLALVQPCTVEFLEGDEVVGELEVGIASGRPACVAIRALHGYALTGAYLRGLSIAEVVRGAALSHTVRVFRSARGAFVGLRYVEHADLGFGDDFRELSAHVEATVTRKRRKLDPEFLKQVAQVYREALGTEPPAQAVQERFGPTSAENARRWIALARDRGFLGKAPGRGQTGEQRGGG